MPSTMPMCGASAAAGANPTRSCSAPFHDDAPRSRLYGRKLSVAWWLARSARGATRCAASAAPSRPCCAW
jgi:hypothetical protein